MIKKIKNIFRKKDGDIEDEMRAIEQDMREVKKEVKLFSKFEGLMLEIIIILIVGVVVGVLLGWFFGMTQAQNQTLMSSGQVKSKVLDYVQSGFPTGVVASISDVNMLSSKLYSIKMDITQDGSSVGEIWVFSDGKVMYLVGNEFDLNEPLPQDIPDDPNPEPPVEVQKSDKPSVELFVMSHCPYGTQAEKGILPVVNALGDSIDFKIRFVYYAMHQDTEVYEELNQYCIREEQNEKFIPYLECFLVDGNGERCLGVAGIDSAELSACTTAADTEFEVTANLEDQSSWLSGYYPLFNVDAELNDWYDVGGSPTLVINGTEIPSIQDSSGASFYAYNDQIIPFDRSPKTYAQILCSLFNTAPAECDGTFSSVNPSSGFGYTGSGSDTPAQCS